MCTPPLLLTVTPYHHVLVQQHNGMWLPWVQIIDDFHLCDAYMIGTLIWKEPSSAGMHAGSNL